MSTWLIALQLHKLPEEVELLSITDYNDALTQIVNFANFIRGDKLELQSVKDKQRNLEREFNSIKWENYNV